MIGSVRTWPVASPRISSRNLYPDNPAMPSIRMEHLKAAALYAGGSSVILPPLHREEPRRFLQPWGDPMQSPGADPPPLVDDRPTDLDARRMGALLDSLLDDVDLRIVRMRFFDRLTLPEIADRLAMEFAEVQRRYRALLRRLEDVLGDWL